MEILKKLYNKMSKDLAIGGSNNAPRMSGLVKVLEQMKLDKNSVFVDFGSGFGLPSIAACLLYGCRCYGVDCDSVMVEKSNEFQALVGLGSDQCTFSLLNLKHLDTKWIQDRKITHVYTFDKVIAPEEWNIMQKAVSSVPAVVSIASNFAVSYWFSNVRRPENKIRVQLSGSGEGKTFYIF
jgi:hypothetical protein